MQITVPFFMLAEQAVITLVEEAKPPHSHRIDITNAGLMKVSTPTFPAPVSCYLAAKIVLEDDYRPQTFAIELRDQDDTRIMGRELIIRDQWRTPPILPEPYTIPVAEPVTLVFDRHGRHVLGLLAAKHFLAGYVIHVILEG